MGKFVKSFDFDPVESKRHYAEAEKTRAEVRRLSDLIVKDLSAMAWAAANWDAQEALELRVSAGKKCDEMKSFIAETCKAKT